MVIHFRKFLEHGENLFQQQRTGTPTSTKDTYLEFRDDQHTGCGCVLGVTEKWGLGHHKPAQNILTAVVLPRVGLEGLGLGLAHVPKRRGVIAMVYGRFFPLGA